MYDRYRIGNAQTIGDQEYQSNYFSFYSPDWANKGRMIRRFYREDGGGDSLMGILANGGIDHVNGRKSAVLSVRTGLAEFCAKAKEETPEQLFDRTVKKIQRRLRDYVYLGKTPCVSYSSIYRTDDCLHYCNIGSNRMFVYEKEEMTLLKERNSHKMLPGTCMVGIMSCGIYAALNEVELLQLLELDLSPYDKSVRIIEAVNEKCHKPAANATIMLVEG